MAKKKPNVEAEWSHFFDVTDLGGKPATLDISADQDQCAALARRFDLLSLGRLSAEIKIARRSTDNVLHVSGVIHAALVQACVISGDPVEAEINEEFEAWFADPAQVVSFHKARRDKQIKESGADLPILDESEDPESITGGQLDLGELVAQHLSLLIDPYPHAPGAHYEVGDDTIKPQGETIPNPFAKLKEWKDQQK